MMRSQACGRAKILTNAISIYKMATAADDFSLMCNLVSPLIIYNKCNASRFLPMPFVLFAQAPI